MKIVIVFLVRSYQRFISPLLPPACRFVPTCSEYFCQAVGKKGVLRGSLLGIWTLLRCNPLCEGGEDPVA